jgi:small-conductance mechanosensitive channel
MNFGQNLYNWFLSNAQSLVLMAIVVIGIYLGFKREFSKLIGFLVVALVAVGLVFNASGVKDVLLQLFNKIIGILKEIEQNIFKAGRENVREFKETCVILQTL